jgi:hypothetical protein
LVRMHIQCIDRQVIGGKLEGFEHLREGEVFLVTEDNDILFRLIEVEL